MAFNFEGKRALVTGAGKGIGRAVAMALHKLGANTVGLSRTQEDLDTLKEQCPGMEPVTQDLRDWTSTREMVSKLGHFDLLVNNAGVFTLAPFLDLQVEEVDRIFDINFKAAFNVSQVVARGMVEKGTGGSVVNVSSIASKLAVQTGLAAYSPSKAALDSLTQVMALELGQHKIRVNSVHPTVVLTDMGQWANKTAEGKAILNRIPLQRFVEVDDVTNTILFLLSDQSAMVNGATIMLDGGFSCH